MGSYETKISRCSKNKTCTPTSSAKEFDILKMKTGESVNEYLTRTLVMVNKMKKNGENKIDAEVVSNILRSMTSKFNYVMYSIEESKETSILTIDELQSSFLMHEQRINMTSLTEEAQELKISFEE
ncbi:uncharacterized protein LOC108455474 [Gossypium arboreum]|uniref:uncharacterized protein LOC108455474 n=1 Tax=Gossypium arboreum TaxID=29729 RepID=UPI00081915A9|nr:uncharacterized protein LOC108455474 [Gossypium arboreum]